MLEALRKFLQSRAGAALTGLIVLIGLVVVVVAVKNSFGDGGAASMSAERMFIDADTGKPFEHTLKLGESIPVKAPSGKNTGYPAEACYWTKAGTPKTEPTWVLVNVWKDSKEPTFCPDCGRLVVGHNPPATAGATPPPTKEEYAKNPRRASRER